MTEVASASSSIKNMTDGVIKQAAADFSIKNMTNGVIKQAAANLIIVFAQPRGGLQMARRLLTHQTLETS